MNTAIRALVIVSTLCGISAGVLGDEPAEPSKSTKVVRIGAVAYAPNAVVVFQGLQRYLNGNGFPSDYVLYSNYDALVAALDQGEVDIAWNTPLAHGQYHVKNQCSSQTLVMRDVDFNLHSTLIVRTDAGIGSPGDLAGKQLVLGSSQSAEATVLPLHFLKLEGVDLGKVQIVSLDKEFDSQGNPCASPQHVLQALRDGRGQAGIITTGLWNRVKDQPSISNVLSQVWVSPPFSHCVFTASAKFDQRLAARFTQLMTEMDPRDPLTSDVMRLEGTKRWLPGSPDGFESLVEALREKSSS